MKIKMPVLAVFMTCIAAGAGAQEDKVAELEKQLRATQEFFASELLSLKSAAEPAARGAGGKKELSQVTTSAKKAQLKEEERKALLARCLAAPAGRRVARAR